MEVTFAKEYSAILKDLLDYLGLRKVIGKGGLMVEQSLDLEIPKNVFST